MSQIKGEMKEYSIQMKDEAIIKTHTYINIIAKDIKEQLNTRFYQLIEFLLDTRIVLKGTPPKAALGALEN